VQDRQGLQVSAPEEIAYRMGFISATQLREAAAALGKTDYGAYLKQIADEA